MIPGTGKGQGSSSTSWEGKKLAFRDSCPEYDGVRYDIWQIMLECDNRRRKYKCSFYIHVRKLSGVAQQLRGWLDFGTYLPW